jgi:hypothetical protein
MAYGANPYGYAEAHGLDVPALIEKLNADFQSIGGIY